MRIRIQNYHFHILYCKNFIMSARLIRLVYLRLASALQLCPKWTCNNVQKYFAILSKKGLQKTTMDEMNDINGGGAILGAVILVGKIVGGCAAVGFVGGCGYELIFG